MKCKVKIRNKWRDGVVLGEQIKTVGIFFKKKVKYYLVSHKEKYHNELSGNFYEVEETDLFEEDDVIIVK